MHYYQFHIGDYRADTAHLSNDEDLAYRRLLDMYYDTEKPIPLDTQWVARRIRSAVDVVDVVLNDMFERTDEGWRKRRCDDEIERYHENAQKNRRNGSKGGRPPQNPVGSESDPTGKATNNQQPLTNNQEPILSEEAIASLSGSQFPPCPHGQILELYKQHLPHLPQHRTWEGKRQANLRARWVQASKPSSYSPEGYTTGKDGLDWWSSFFEFIANDTKLARGFETNGRVWVPDLEWMTKAENFNKIIDGKYNK